MAKPIFLIKVSEKVPKEKADSIFFRLQTQLTDWHVIVAGVLPEDALPDFIALNVENMPEIDLEALRKELSV